MSNTKIDNAYALNFYTDGVEPLTIDIHPTEWSDEYGLTAIGDILDTVHTDGRWSASDFVEDWVTATVTEHGVGLELPTGVDLNARDMDKLAGRLVRLHGTEEAGEEVEGVSMTEAPDEVWSYVVDHGDISPVWAEDYYRTAGDDLDRLDGAVEIAGVELRPSDILRAMCPTRLNDLARAQLEDDLEDGSSAFFLTRAEAEDFLATTGGAA